MLLKRAYSVQMSFDVPEAERRMAEKAYESLEDLVGLLKESNRHLDLIYEPFSKVQALDPKIVVEYRKVLRRYRNQIKENFELVLSKYNHSLKLLKPFATDTKTVEMMRSFMANIDDLKKQVNRLLQIFGDLDDDNFKDYLLKAIDSVKKKDNQLKQLINDRILEHIDTNILAKNWTSGISEQEQEIFYDKVPMVVQLFKERQQALSDGQS